MADPRGKMGESLAGGLCALGGGLLVDPQKVLGRAGVKLDGEQAVLLARMVGLRDLVLGFLLLSARGVPARRRILLGIAALCAAEVGVLTLARGRLGLRSTAVLIGTTAVAGSQALYISTSDTEMSANAAPLLAAGYALSAGPTLSLGPIVKTGDRRRFAAFVAGATLIGLGWLRRKNYNGAVVNFGAAVGATAWWIFTRVRQGKAPARE